MNGNSPFRLSNINKIYVIDPAWGQGGWILAKFFFAVLLTKTNSRLIKTHTQKTRPIYCHLNHASLLNKGFIIWRKRELVLAEPMQEILNWQGEPLTRLGSQSKCKICFILSACWLSHACIIRMLILGEQG